MSLLGGLEEVVEFFFRRALFALQIRDSCQRSVQLFLQLGDHGLQPFTARTMFSVCPHASTA